MNLLSTSLLALWFLLSSTVKTTVLLGLAAGGAYLLRHHSAARRHYVWALGIASSIALPLPTLLLPSWHSATLGNAAPGLGSCGREKHHFSDVAFARDGCRRGLAALRSGVRADFAFLGSWRSVCSGKTCWQA